MLTGYRLSIAVQRIAQLACFLASTSQNTFSVAEHSANIFHIFLTKYSVRPLKRYLLCGFWQGLDPQCSPLGIRTQPFLRTVTEGSLGCSVGARLDLSKGRRRDWFLQCDAGASTPAIIGLDFVSRRKAANHNTIEFPADPI